MTDTSSSPLSVSTGSPFPLGATATEDGSVNFAVVSQFAHSVTLCLFADTSRPAKETHRVPLVERSGDTWHAAVSGIPDKATYGYRVDGIWDPRAGMFFNSQKLLLDPYATRIDGLSEFHKSLVSKRKDGKADRSDSRVHAPRACVPTPEVYDWESDAPPCLPMSETVVCEMHVKGFSKLNPAVPEDIRGTYAGLAHESSIGYLRDLGVTTVQLLPVHQHLDDGFLLDRGLVNYWGYNTLGFFAPEARYAATDDPIREFRDMVKALHRGGLEVILDVVYNHTCEAGVDGPTCLLRGFDNAAYYHTDPIHPGTYRDFTGCGNSVDVSHPRALRLVMDSLRYWIEEMHVDGFRFDLAVELGRRGDNYDRRAAFFQAVYQDPVIGRTKLVAEPWDLGPGGYQIGNFPTEWCELNGKFRDGVRCFWRGDPGVSGEFAARITGSEDLFAHNRRLPQASVNMITSHDGFTLHDLVSYNQKHNLPNGEKNADGESHNNSDNHGIEGPTQDRKILELRRRQIRNFLATMICSQGVPFLLAGDERLRTKGGNNNSYCQDNEISWISWDDAPEAVELRNFVRRMLNFRRDNPLLRRTAFFTGKKAEGADFPDVCWLRPDGGVKDVIDWGVEEPGAFAMFIHGKAGRDSLLFFFNARAHRIEFHFPENETKVWKLVADTVDPELEGTTKMAGKSLYLTDRSMQIWQSA
ncbi:MAG: glycogen debranching protein GlgX [Verrucomicrobiales bacterium]